ncbi:IS200/IS605 family transposase [Kiritimatiellaeota bacterium B1221]|nr:IS200/IS605 family transposase [Kiritimatiellaeota bacterium B1221]
MPQSLCQLYVHLVFSTKNRHPFISDQHLEPLHAYLQNLSTQADAPTLQVGSVADHIHLLARFPRTLTIAKWVSVLKSNSSRWMKEKIKNANHPLFSWQAGYGAFSISPTHVDALVHYIQNQKSHHHTESFQDEYRRFLKKYDIPYDERYVWD